MTKMPLTSKVRKHGQVHSQVSDVTAYFHWQDFPTEKDNMGQDRPLLPLKPAPEILHSCAGRRQEGQGRYSTPVVEASLRSQN